ncbi:PPC domain-containing DNA-binding protein [Herbidospora sp. RD11066]
MEWIRESSDIFIRIDPGELMIQSLARAAREMHVTTGVLLSGVGMFEQVTLGYFNATDDEYIQTKYEGIYDVSSIAGNISQRRELIVPHIHAIFNDASHSTLSGHVIEATCHVTMEIFMSTSRLDIERVKLPGIPATRIMPRRVK